MNISGAVLLCLLLHYPSLAATQHPRALPAPIHVRIALSSHPGNIAYLPLDLAMALHYFTDGGLDVTFTYHDGGPNTARALESEQAEFSGNSIDYAIRMRDAAHPLKMVFSFTNLPAVTLVIRRSLRAQIRSVKDLRGHRIGVASTDSGTHAITASILESAGVPLHSVSIIAVGQGARMFAALKSGSIDAAIATDPAAIQMLVGGDTSLMLDLVTFDETQRVFTGNYQFTGLMTRSDVIANHPELVQKMVNVLLRTSRFINSHSATDIAALLPPSAKSDSFVFVRSIEHSRPSFSQNGLVTLQGVSNNIKSQKALGLLSADQKLNPADFFEMSFVNTALRR